MVRPRSISGIPSKSSRNWCTTADSEWRSSLRASWRLCSVTRSRNGRDTHSWSNLVRYKVRKKESSYMSQQVATPSVNSTGITQLLQLRFQYFVRVTLVFRDSGCILKKKFLFKCRQGLYYIPYWYFIRFVMTGIKANQSTTEFI